MKPDELKATMKEIPRRYADPLASEVNDKDGYWSTPELECSFVDDFTNGSENEKLRNFIPPCTVPSGFFEKHTDFYTDKNVMECELPELIVCYKESAYHVVKDICIDEGIPSEDKILINNDKDNHEVPTSLPVNRDKQTDIIKESLAAEFLIEDGLRSSSGTDCNKSGAIEYEAKEKVDDQLLSPDNHKDICTSLPTINDHSDMSEVCGDTDGLRLSSAKDFEVDSAKECEKEKVKTDLLIPEESKLASENDNDTDDTTTSNCGSDGLNLPGESNTGQGATDNCTPDRLTITGEEIFMDGNPSEELVSNRVLPESKYRPQTSPKFLLESSDGGDDDAEQQPGQFTVEEISHNPAVGSGGEERSKSDETTTMPYDTNVDSGAITFSFDSAKPAASTGGGNRENDQELPLQPQNVPIYEDDSSDKISISSQVQRGGDGETSFTVTGPVSGLITFSGPIASSGSTSLRSDSSTTSTRSFAFPILQSEWNSSPVRMAKAERRRCGKHRGWRHGLLCCRF